MLSSQLSNYTKHYQNSKWWFIVISGVRSQGYFVHLLLVFQAGYWYTPDPKLQQVLDTTTLNLGSVSVGIYAGCISLGFDWKTQDCYQILIDEELKRDLEL